jgi:hypothetical protein
VDTKLDESASLQRRFDVWAGNWLGGKKAKAHAEAAKEIQEANKKDQSKVKEVFENEKYDSLSRVWKSAGMTLCTDPSIGAPDVFDPNALQTAESSWSIDYSLANIDAEGWTYAFDFATLNRSGTGEVKAKWNSYVRRRKWRYSDRGKGGGALDE